MASQLTVRDFLLLTYKAFNDAIRGKTTLQKRVYFLSVFLKMNLGYAPHYYGPYSESVASANAELKCMGYLREFVSPWGHDSHGFEMARYDYGLTPEGKRLAAEKAALFGELWQRLREAASAIKRAGDLSYMELSVAAKAYYVLGLKGRATRKEISEMLPNFGWSVSAAELQRATEFLKKMNLVCEAKD